MSRLGTSGGTIRLCRELGALGPRRLAWACCSGTLAAGCAIGLLGTSGWLITRASLRPPVLSLSIAIGAVQAFAIGRGVTRYLERLAVHDVSLSALGRLRLLLYDTLEPLVPGALGPGRSGSVLSAFVNDCETVVDALAKVLGAGIDFVSSVLLGMLLAFFLDPANRQESIDILQKAGNLDQQEVIESYDFAKRINFFDTTGKVSPVLLGNLMKVLIAMGELKAPIPMDKIALQGVTQVGD